MQIAWVKLLRKMICFPNIKINLGLRIIDRRNDGFHTIESVFYPVNFQDALEIIPLLGEADGTIVCEFSGIPVEGKSSDNLIVKAYQAVAAFKGGLPAVKVLLHKVIPMGAGLGGGSSDAACMIKLLNDQFSLGMDIATMEKLAASLGSDCAFFIQNKPAYLLGRGPELIPIDFKLDGWYLVLCYPGVHSNTALAYKHTSPRGGIPNGISLQTLLEADVSAWRETIENDFEASVFQTYPQIASCKEALYASGAVYASMSGSGSAVFGLFKQKPQLEDQLRPLVCYENWL